MAHDLRWATDNYQQVHAYLHRKEEIWNMNIGMKIWRIKTGFKPGGRMGSFGQENFGKRNIIFP